MKSWVVMSASEEVMHALCAIPWCRRVLAETSAWYGRILFSDVGIFNVYNCAIVYRPF